MQSSLIKFAGIFLCLLSSSAAADITGKVIAVNDGDTITIVHERQQIKVRLLEIDAPEKAQPFGNRSKQSLSNLCFGKTATLVSNNKDRYGRTLARVYCNGIDANAEQIRLGMAWVYDRYVSDRELYKLQNEAKVNRRGLWHDENPIPPWDWRRQKRP
jgi:endonuclease YncB( thermonuclease family)